MYLFEGDFLYHLIGHILAPRLPRQTSKFGVVFFVSKSLWGSEKPSSHVKILIYRAWLIFYIPTADLGKKGETQVKPGYLKKAFLQRYFLNFQQMGERDP